MTASEYLELTEIYKNTEKDIIIGNIKRIAKLKENDIKHVNIWLTETTGLGEYVVYQRMSRTATRKDSKFTLEQLCVIANALNVDIGEMFKHICLEPIRRRNNITYDNKYNDIVKLRNNMTFKELGEHYNISTQRASKIYKQRLALQKQNNKEK